MFDKFRGTATARELGRTVALAASRCGWECDDVPMADGGEGTLDVVNGQVKTSKVAGPLGSPVMAKWVIDGPLAVIEMAQAAGLQIVGGPELNRPLEATTAGVGELIALAMRSGAEEIVVGMGGSATIDGGLGCVEALWPQSRLREITLTVASDVDTLFLDAPRAFGLQKGATASQIALLERRLERLAADYQKKYGVDVTQLPGSGAAGGLAGGLAALGAHIVPGFEYLADLVGLDAHIEQADLVITGEGTLDAHSFDGKVVGGVIAMARRAGVPVAAAVGRVDRTELDSALLNDVNVVSLVERFGAERALDDTLDCVREVVTEQLGGVE